MGILSNECHLHLYGCLSQHDLWQHLRPRMDRYRARFEWYLAEHQRLTGKTPRTDLWWNEDRGFDMFSQDFLCEHPMPFETFQAKFNLLIALFPPHPDDLTLANAVFKSHQNHGGYKEYRVFLPVYLAGDARALYLRRLIETARSYETVSYHPRLAISIQRQDEEAWNSYEFLAAFLGANQALAPWVTGVDFCGSEQGHPPSRKKHLFERIARDNDQGRQHLNILYHVGEMWQDIALHSAARWCAETARMGVKRLGHAMALGMNPQSLRGRVIFETFDESAAHLTWLRRHGHALHEYGFSRNDYGWVARQTEHSSSQDKTIWRYDDDLIEHTRILQQALMRMVANTGAMIECCPSSNMRIGGLREPSYHPLRNFIDHHIPVTIATDDPGIFNITLSGEEDFVRTNLGVSDQQLHQANDLAGRLMLQSSNQQFMANT